MKIRNRRASLPLIGLLVLTLGAGPSWAEKPAWAGQGKGGKHNSHEGSGHVHKDAAPATPAVTVHVGAYFGEPQRVAARNYYGAQARGGKCPPGLAKKNNGCLPPGQAKKWVMGRPLPREVVWYPVPQPVVVQLGAPPAGYRYVRVAADILLIAVGTGMVIDAMEDLARF
ncbi:MAG: RcnB family protein [Ramlibacter sp.]|nr:RcnB family protein [Ramlibacter sp.]